MMKMQQQQLYFQRKQQQKKTAFVLSTADAEEADAGKAASGESILEEIGGFLMLMEGLAEYNYDDSGDY